MAGRQHGGARTVGRGWLPWPAALTRSFVPQTGPRFALHSGRYHTVRPTSDILVSKFIKVLVFKISFLVFIFT